MLEVTDRKPLGNGKNNIIKPATIPNTITTVADLIAFMNAGFYADVQANNDLGANAGVSAIGTPSNKALFDSIEEGSMQWALSGDMNFQAYTATTTAGWTWVAFQREFQAVPKVVATVSGDNTGLHIVRTKGVTNKGFYAAVVSPSDSSLTTTRGTATDSAYVSGIGSHAHSITGGFVATVTMNSAASAFIATNIDYIAAVCDNLTNY